MPSIRPPPSNDGRRWSAPSRAGDSRRREKDHNKAATFSCIRPSNYASPTISAAIRGNPRAIYRGFGELSSGQRQLLAQLEGPGSRALVRKGAVTQRDLAALTVATGDEFAVFTTGGRRLVIRGGPDGFHGIIDGQWAASMRAQGWRFSAHTYPVYEGAPTHNFLRSSPGDREIIRIFGQDRSAILNSVGERQNFGPNGDLLTGWLP